MFSCINYTFRTSSFRATSAYSTGARKMDRNAGDHSADDDDGKRLLRIAADPSRQQPQLDCLLPEQSVGVILADSVSEMRSYLTTPRPSFEVPIEPYQTIPSSAV
jgi:hypothetical protein